MNTTKFLVTGIERTRVCIVAVDFGHEWSSWATYSFGTRIPHCARVAVVTGSAFRAWGVATGTVHTAADSRHVALVKGRTSDVQAFARVADGIAIGIELIWIEECWTVVARIANSIPDFRSQE